MHFNMMHRAPRCTLSLENAGLVQFDFNPVSFLSSLHVENDTPSTFCEGLVRFFALCTL
jgi:hypothetical protein